MFTGLAGRKEKQRIDTASSTDPPESGQSPEERNAQLTLNGNGLDRESFKVQRLKLQIRCQFMRSGFRKRASNIGSPVAWAFQGRQATRCRGRWRDAALKPKRGVSPRLREARLV
ncbi:MAG: hypothetical protein CBB71_04505 [Rhodopirellula sp. TMED11]|nr:MAG: hypothetical protein CBB71_04505 [Rhodopirellula sp. TMED11]